MRNMMTTWVRRGRMGGRSRIQLIQPAAATSSAIRHARNLIVPAHSASRPSMRSRRIPTRAYLPFSLGMYRAIHSPSGVSISV